jgi:hypothetical protein
MSESDNNVPSIQRRLLNLSRAQSQDHQFTLIRYGLERLLYRISISKYANAFILKGGFMGCNPACW